MKAFFWVVITLFSLSSNVAYSQGKDYKIVIQFTNAADTLQQKAITNQLMNLTAHWPDAEIEVVMFNQGVDYLLPVKGKHAESIAELKNNGVRFVVCENTIKKRNLSRQDFIPEAEFVKAGIAEIVEKQAEGWHYIVGGF